MSKNNLEKTLIKATQLHSDGAITDAKKHYKALIKKKYSLAKTHNLLGILYLQQTQYTQAIGHLQQALDHGNKDPDILYNIGLCHAEMIHFEAAITSYNQCIERNQTHPSAWYNLALAYQKTKQFDCAIDAFNKDFELHQRIESLRELAAVYIKKMDWDNTEKYAIACLKQQPDCEVALHCLANARLGRLASAEIPDLNIIEQVMRIGKNMIASNPTGNKGYEITGDALQTTGELDLALEFYEKALTFMPDNALIHANVGVISLLKGQLQKGFAETSWRADYGNELYGMDQSSISECQSPTWQGQIEVGKHLLVASEQGIGDQIMQAQLVCELIEKGMRVTMTCNEKLTSLLARSIPEATIVDNNQRFDNTSFADVDCKCTQMDLCRFMRTSLEDFAPRSHYLQADPALVAHFKHKYSQFGKVLKVGISWKSVSVSAGKRKSTDLDQWQQLLKTPGIQFICIQYGDYAEDLTALKKNHGINVYADDEFNPFDDIEKATAQIAALDLVISISNASVHLAGAIGVPTWAILYTTPLWHWFLERRDSVWYQSVSLYRQQQLAGWQPVLSEITKDLGQLVEKQQM